MDFLKKWFRMAGFALLIILACMGLFSGAFMLPRTKEKSLNKEITTEQVDKLRKTIEDD